MEGNYESTISLEGSTGMEIGFGGQNMLDMLSRFKGKVDIYLNKPTGPMKAIPEGDKNNIAVLLPRRPRE